MKRLLRENASFLIPYILILIVTGIIQLFYSKAEMHLLINKFHTSRASFIFKNITYLGDGNFVGILCILFLLFSSLRNTFFLASLNITVGLVTQFLKRVVFPDILRPVAYFKDMQHLNLVEGIDMHSHFSFPSGHSATAFALFFALAILTRSQVLKKVYLFFAILTAFSRIYLSQHFLIDTWAGSIIGIITVIPFYFLILQNKSTWLDKNIFKLKRHA